MTQSQTEMSNQRSAESALRKVGRMEQIIERMATGLGNGVTFLADHGVLFVIFALIWLGFGVALIWSQGSLDAAWQWSRDLSWILQGVVWLLFLPVMLALWAWETSWSLFMRAGLVVALAVWTLVIFPPPWK